MKPDRIATGSRRLLGWTCLAAALLPSASLATEGWQYSGEYGPEKWGRMRPEYAPCDQGRRQSPIDIVTPQRRALPELQFQYRSTSPRIVNDGHTVRVRFANDNRLLIGGEIHTLQQFHFHTPGGDRIQGEEFPLAMHFLHKDSHGRLVSLVVLFRLGTENAALAALLPKMPPRGRPEQALPDMQVDPGQFLPGSHSYFAYDGSLTAPPCTEGVRWIVLKQPMQLSAAQLARLQQQFPSNARPVQPLNGRPVAESP